MLNLKEIEDRLWNLTVADIHKVCCDLSLKKTGHKGILIDRIIEFYSEDNWVEKTYKSLNEYEKELIDNLVKQNFYPTYDSVKEIQQKYENTGLSISKYNYFFINEETPYIPFVKNYLK